MYQRYSRVLGLWVLFTLPLAARKPGELPKPGLNMFSRDQDQQLGAEAAKEVRTKYKTLDNKFLQDYVKRVGDRLAATKEAAGSKFPFTFTFIVEPTINAFALPGGPMFIQTGLFPALDNEAQLAGVMAHEMSHVILRHGTHEATKAKGVGLVASFIGAAAGDGMMGGMMKEAVSLGANTWMLHYSREAESEADALGAFMMAEAGWDPMELGIFFTKLNQAGGQRPMEFLSDHPNPDHREAAIEAEVKAMPTRTYGYETGDFGKVKQFIVPSAQAATQKGAPVKKVAPTKKKGK